MRYYGFRHEQAAAHAADGYGRATGKPGVVLLSTGPGALNALSALGEAYASSSPVLAISSHIPSNLVGKGKGYLHESKDLGPAFSSVSAYHARADSAGDIPRLLTEALAACVGGRPRPAFLEIPTDFLDVELEADPVKLSLNPADPDDGQIDHAVFLLGLSARPVVWAGGGVLRSGAHEEVQRVAELLGAPVITTFMGKGAISEDHPLAVGTMVRQPEAAELLRNADLILAVGTRFTGMSTGNWKLMLPPQLIHVDIDASEIGRNYPVRHGVNADAKIALRRIARALEDKELATTRWGEDEAKKIRTAAFARAREEGPRELAMLEAVRSAIDPDFTVVHDMTVPSYWSWPFYKVTRPGRFHSPYGFASLGFSFPAAIGVAASAVGRPVVAFTGDGGFQYHLRELATVAQYNLPIITVVFNDEAWGVLKSFSGARYGNHFGLSIPSPDFVALATSYAVPAARAKEPEELEKELKKAVEAGGPHVIEVPGEWALPPPSEYYRR